MTPAPPGTRDYALLVTLSAIWGASFLFIKIGVETVPAATLTASRLGLAAVLLLAVARLAGETMPRGGRLWGWIIVAAFSGSALPFTLISWGEEAIDSGLAAILMAVMPLTTVLVAHVFTRDEKLSPRKGIGVSFGLAGLVILIGPDQLARLGDDTIRQLAVAAAAFCYGVNAVITKQLVRQPPRALSAALCLASTAMLLPLSLAVDRPWTLAPSGRSMLAIIVLGVLQTAIAGLIMLALVRRQGASFFSQINFLVPLFGVLLGALVLAERPPASAIAALAVILMGVAIARESKGRSPASAGRDDAERTGQ